MDNKKRAEKWISSLSPWQPISRDSLTAEFDAVAEEARGLISKDSIGGYRPVYSEEVERDLDNYSADPIKTPWKPGQMLIHKDEECHYICKLVSERSGFWTYERFRNNKWDPVSQDLEDDFSASDGWQPYPRVRDWVRNSAEDKTFQVVGLHYDGWPLDSDGSWHNPIYLEPASPPVEEFIKATDVAENARLDAALHAPANTFVAKPPVEKHDCSCTWKHGFPEMSEAHIDKLDPHCEVHGSPNPHECDELRYTTIPKPTLEGPHWDKVVDYADRETPDFVCIATLDLREVARDHEERIKELEKSKK